jgi:hypothetical protein
VFYLMCTVGAGVSLGDPFSKHLEFCLECTEVFCLEGIVNCKCFVSALFIVYCSVLLKEFLTVDVLKDWYCTVFL